MNEIFDGPGIESPLDKWPRFAAACLLGLLALSSGVLLTEPPRGPLKRPSSEPDMPWRGHGLSEVYISSEGTWTITRRGYADREARYTITADGSLSTVYDRSLPYQGEDVSGAFNDAWQGVAEGTSLRVTSRRGTGYRDWLGAMRKERLENYLNPLPGEAAETAEPAAEPENTTDGSSPDSAAGQMDTAALNTRELLDRAYSAVTVVFNMRDELVDIEVLDDHWFFLVYDAACFADPYIYLTTDRQRMLHKLRVDQGSELPRIELLSSSKLDLGPEIPSRRCRVVRDPQRGICILQSNGMRYWFDPDTLEAAGSDKLPGVWEPEYAAFDLRPGRHSHFLGEPLTKAQYNRVMRAIMLVFLVSLLGLAMLWRPQWKSTSALTTAD